MTSIAIIGNGGHGRMLEGVLRRMGARNRGTVKLYHTDDANTQADWVVIGLGNSPKTGDSDLKARAALFEKHGGAVKVAGVVDPYAVVVNAVVHTTAQLMPGVIVQNGATVGANTILNTGCIVEHDCAIGEHCHVAPGAVLCGKVTVGDYTHIGARAVVKQGVRVGAGCVIGMGAVIRRDVADGETVW